MTHDILPTDGQFIKVPTENDPESGQYVKTPPEPGPSAPSEPPSPSQSGDTEDGLTLPR